MIRRLLAMLGRFGAETTSTGDRAKRDTHLARLHRTATPVRESEIEAKFGPSTERVEKLADSRLPCCGCAHSASSVEFPGMPSGERPCGFCVRNPMLGFGEVADWFGEEGPMWYGGRTPPFKTPMDCYIATDRLTQQRIFDTLGRLEQEGKTAPPRERHPLSGESGEVWCCEGGGGPRGHAWTCWRWLGMSFG